MIAKSLLWDLKKKKTHRLTNKLTDWRSLTWSEVPSVALAKNWESPWVFIILDFFLFQPPMPQFSQILCTFLSDTSPNWYTRHFFLSQKIHFGHITYFHRKLSPIIPTTSQKWMWVLFWLVYIYNLFCNLAEVCVNNSLPGLHNCTDMKNGRTAAVFRASPKLTQ